MSKIEIPNTFEIRTTELISEIQSRLIYLQLEMQSINNIVMQLDSEIQELKRNG